MNKYIALKRAYVGSCSNSRAYLLIVFVLFLTGNSGCTHTSVESFSTGGHDYLQVNLVADTAGFGAARIDTTLDNPWGMGISPSGKFWIGVNHNGSTAIYDGNGNELLSNVDIPFGGISNGSSPDGCIYNSTTDFLVNGKPAKYIFSTEDGIIAGWNTGDTTVTVADRSSVGAIYKGLTTANDGTGNFIYATDFFNARIDVFDHSFGLVANKPFSDPGIPAGFAPFNIRNIGGRLYVTYAKQKGPDNEDDLAGPGNGYVDIFTLGGILVKRFASQGTLNSPWGIVEAPAAFGQGTNNILIANFGDGTINVFDTAGVYKGKLENNGAPISINGLWDIAFSSTSNTQMYFTAGPMEEIYGIFGYLKVK